MAETNNNGLNTNLAAQPDYNAWHYGDDYNGYRTSDINKHAQWGSLRDSDRYNAMQANYDYLNNVTNAMNKLRNDMSRESAKYMTGVGAANTNYTDAVNQASQGYSGALQNYANAAGNYVGNQGYQNALNQAQRGATQAGYNAASTAQAAARNAGMNKAQAAALGMGNAINGYNNQLANQQAQVQNNYNNALNTMGNVLNGQGNIYGQQTNMAGNRYGQTLNAMGNSYSTDANTINSAASGLTQALQQDVANRQNQQTINYNNQDVIEKLLSGLDSSTSGTLGKWINPLSWLSSIGGGVK